MQQQENRLLTSYFRDIRGFQLKKDKKQEIELLKKAKSGDKESFEKLIKSNLRYVLSVAREYKYQNKGLEFEDLISAGNIGLIEAVEAYDVDKNNTTFLCYADSHIRKSIRNEITEVGSMVREPENILRDKTRERKLLIHNMKSYNDFHYAHDYTDFNYTNTVSLNNHINDGENDSIEMSDFLKSTYLVYNDLNLNTDNIVSGKELCEIRKMLVSLNEDERYIIERMFGFDCQEANSIAEIADELDLSQPRTKAIYNTAIKKLRCCVLESEIKS